MGRLNGKIAIVTGAGRGIGRATAKLFAAEGAKVAVLSLTPANVEAVVLNIEAAGGTALGVPCDVSDAEQIKAAVDKVGEVLKLLEIGMGCRPAGGAVVHDRRLPPAAAGSTPWRREYPHRCAPANRCPS